MTENNQAVESGGKAEKDILRPGISSKSKRKNFLTLALCTTILLSPWLYDHGMFPSFPRNPACIIIGWFPVALPLYTDYIENPIWQLHGVYGWWAGLRSYDFTCEFSTSEKVLLRNPSSWIKGTSANIPSDIYDEVSHNDLQLPPDLVQGIKNSDFEYWYRDKYPSETTVLIHKKGSEHYYLSSMGAG